jgi:MFS family permease
LSDILAPTYCFAVLLGARLVYAVFASGALPAVSSFIAARALEDDRASAMAHTGLAFSLGSLGSGALTFVTVTYLGVLSRLLCVAVLSVLVLLALPCMRGSETTPWWQKLPEA